VCALSAAHATAAYVAVHSKMRTSLQRIPALDGLRGLAALFVLFGHFPWIEHLTFIRRTATWFDSGSLGVDMFFALSGFLITRIILAGRADGTFSFATFYFRRALRIFPIYYLTILAVGIFITWHRSGWLALYLGNFAFAFDPEPHPMRHAWSLAVEEHFYLIWPFLLVKLPRRAARRMVFPILPLVSIVLAVITCQLMPAEEADALIIRGSMYRMLSICLGAWVAFHEARFRDLPLPLILVMSVLAFLLPHLTIQSLEWHIGRLFLSNYTCKLVVLSSASLCWLLIVLNLDRLAARYLVLRLPHAILTDRTLMFIGTISYGLYLYHYPLLYAKGMLDEGTIGLGRAAALLALLFAIPIISWYVIERPLLRLKDRHTGRRA
jgi:peptidoglycan/LPS O-acetylase OafA/YrhL